MKINTDSLFSVLTPDLFGSRPTTDFYTCNSIYGSEYAPEDSELQVNHYAQSYMELSLMNLPNYGAYKFYVHTGKNQARFTPIDHMPESRLLERFAIRDFENTLKLAVLKYAILGTYIIVNDDTLSVYA